MSSDKYEIDATRITEELLALLPSVENWEEHLVIWADQERGHYNDMSVFAREVVSLFILDEDEALHTFFSKLEDNLRGASPEIERLLCIGLLEDIQTTALGKGITLSMFEKYMSPYLIDKWKWTYNQWPTVNGYK